MKRKLTLATLALALFSAPALADNTPQQLNEDCAIVANIALDSMGQFQSGNNKSSPLKIMQQK